MTPRWAAVDDAVRSRETNRGMENFFFNPHWLIWCDFFLIIFPGVEWPTDPHC
jgi:hypothetical protein